MLETVVKATKNFKIEILPFRAIFPFKNIGEK
jgi:hypothetical protein